MGCEGRFGVCVWGICSSSSPGATPAADDPPPPGSVSTLHCKASNPARGTPVATTTCTCEPPWLARVLSIDPCHLDTAHRLTSQRRRATATSDGSHSSAIRRQSCSICCTAVARASIIASANSLSFFAHNRTVDGETFAWRHHIANVPPSAICASNSLALCFGTGSAGRPGFRVISSLIPKYYSTPQQPANAHGITSNATGRTCNG